MTTETTSPPKNTILVIRATMREFLQLESASGIILIIVAILAMVIANSPLSGFYDTLLSTTVQVRVGALNSVSPDHN